MTHSLSQQGKWNLMRNLSNKQSEILADRIWKGCMQETPNTETTYKRFCQCVKNNELSIADRFDEFNAENKFTEALPKDLFTEDDVNIFINILITKTAMNVIGSTFYTN